MENHEKDSYRTILEPSGPTLFKEKKSKFLGYSFPLIEEEGVRSIIDELRKKHHTANHVCYAWQVGVENIRYRVQDDGEPNNSAGLPIYGQIQAFGVTNILVAVVRIFGGTKLGVGGLITAYRTSAQMVLGASTIIEGTLQRQFRLTFGYEDLDRVMRTIKQLQIQILSQNMENQCTLVISVRQKDADRTAEIFGTMYPVKIMARD
jgi:uncharacterized YigZ family protein